MATMIILVTSTFILMNHPLTMGLILISQTTLVGLATGMMSPSFWFSYIIFIIMVGGMLVIFIYMTSIAPNEELSFKPWMIILIMSSSSMGMLIEPIINNNSESYSMETSTNMLNKLINLPSSSIIMMAVIYLLLALIAVVNVSKIGKGPLRAN